MLILQLASTVNKTNRKNEDIASLH